MNLIKRFDIERRLGVDQYRSGPVSFGDMNKVGGWVNMA